MNYNSSTADAKPGGSSYRFFDKKYSEWNVLDEEVPAEVILEIFEVARKITGSYDYKEQAWTGLMTHRKDDKFDLLLNCLDNFNKTRVELAPCIGAISERRRYNKKGVEKKRNFYNTEVFIESAVQKAENLGYHLQLMFGFSGKMLKEKFDVPEDYEPKIIFAIGKNNFYNPMSRNDDLEKQIKKDANKTIINTDYENNN